MAPSKFRDLILQSADRIVTHLAERETKRKPTKKRVANTTLDATNDSPNKRSRTTASRRSQAPVPRRKGRNGVKADSALKPIEPSKLNSKASNQKPVEPTVPTTARKPFASVDEEVTRALSSDDEYEVGYQNLDATAKIENDTARKQTIVPAIAVLEIADLGHCAKSRHCSDNFDEDNSLFEELLKCTPEGLQTVQSPTRLPTPNQPLCTPSKHVNATNIQETLTPPSLSSSQAPSPASTNISAVGSPMKAFVRPPPSGHVPAMPVTMPWLKAAHRITTSFRIAEVLRLQSQLIPIDASQEQGHTVELYARIKSAVTQTAGSIVQFADLFFSGRPPYLIGVYKTDEASAVTASIVSAFQSPARPYTQSSQPSEHADSYKLCRAIIRTRSGSSEVYVVSIKETDWAEVEHVRGIVEPEYQINFGKVSKVEGGGETLIVRT